MQHLIDKSALVAVIKKYQSKREKTLVNGAYWDYQEILDFINTLEVIEIGVDVGSPEGDLGRETVHVIDADGNITEVIINKAQKGE